MELSFQPGAIMETLNVFRTNEYEGAVYIQGESNIPGLSNAFVLMFQRGQLAFAGTSLPTVQSYCDWIARKLNLSHLSSAITAASSRVKNPNSLREILGFVSRFGLLKWEDLESLALNSVIVHLERVATCAGTLRSDPEVQIDLGFDAEGQLLSWERIHQGLAYRRQIWNKLSVFVPSMYAVPHATGVSLEALPDATGRHLEEWVNGQRSLLEIAVAMDFDPLKLAQHYADWAQRGWIAFPGSKRVAPSATETSPSSLTESLGATIPKPVSEKVDQLPMILSVDDSQIVQTMIKRAIGDRYQVLLANNAVEALNLLNSNPITLLLLDVTMPDIDGLELCRTIRSISKFRDLPVVMLTAKDGLIDKVKGQFAGSTHYLHKPVDREKLLPVLEKYIPVKVPS